MRARNRSRVAQGLVLALALAALMTAASQAALAGQVAVLRALDKVTARVSILRVPVGEEVRFGTLRIGAKACQKRPPEEPPESAAFLEIDDLRTGKDAVVLFRGWMFASSPALMALEHPIYDVWVIDCKTEIGSK